MKILGYFILFLLLMWFGKKMGVHFKRSGRYAYAYLLVSVVIFIEVIVIYYFVGELIQNITQLLKMFYNET
ncbi:hypothetical protein MUA48_02280 [Staphylococcus sp. IVB6238]|nr:hypothetical protein [Staphylococcus sp. IVB6238]UXR74313.1 hypothetical protein MUA48_02280 [Staphylococcus sp. IVB6238]